MRHLPILGKKTFIELTPPRGICPSCDDHPTTTQTLPWHDRNAHFTKAYEQQILLSLINSTIADVGIKEELAASTVQRIVDKYISEKIDWKTIKKIGIMGMDEISLKKGYRDFVTIITSRIDETIRILAVIKGREKAEIKAFLEEIPVKKRKTITAVCTDMYDGFINASQEVLGSSIPIVVDRFHIAKLYRKSLVSLRKKELDRLRKELSIEEYQSLKSAIETLVKKNECYSRDEKHALEKLFKYSPALKAAYRLTRQLTSIFNTRHRKDTAVIKINEWIENVAASDLICFNSFIKTLNKYKNEVTNYFIDRNTSGFVEGLNNKIKVIKRRCYGIFNIKNLFQRIFLDLQGYQLFNINQQVTSVC
jgi:transposase